MGIYGPNHLPQRYTYSRHPGLIFYEMSKHKPSDRVLRLRRERLARGWSQLDVTARTRIAQCRISLIERDRLEYIPPAWKNRLAAAFGIPAEELYAVDEEISSIVREPIKSVLISALSSVKEGI